MDTWRNKRVGYISASRLSDLMTKGKGKIWGQTAISYLKEVEMERFLGRVIADKDAPALRFGRENEPYAIEWLRENVSPDIISYETDFPEKPFLKVDWAMYGATPDTEWVEKNILIEIKCVYSIGQICDYFSPSRPYERKRVDALSEHRDQIVGQFLAKEDIKEIWILKYNPQRDEIDEDITSPIDESRGILFKFTREEMGSYITEVKEKIIWADLYLKSGKDLEMINESKLVRETITNENDQIIYAKYLLEFL